MMSKFANVPTLRVFIIGDGGFARELAVYLKEFTPCTPILVSKEDIPELKKLPYPESMILGSGIPAIKKRMLAEVQDLSPIFTIFAHPHSTVHTDLNENSDGTVIGPGAVVAPNTVIGAHVLINYGATVGHDSTVGNLSVISPNASIGGNCHLGKGVYIGAGAMIRENIRIADGVTVGMGAVVTKDILEPNITVVGIPAKPLEKK